MRSLKIAVAIACSFVAFSEGSASAQTTQAGAQASGTAQLGGTSSVSTTGAEFFDNYSIRLGFLSAGPLLFRDTPDGRVQQTSVFAFGPRLAFLFGNEIRDIHRAGLGISYLPVARSDARNLAFVPIALMYEIGHPLVLQTALGANIAAGSSEFTKNYGGVHTGLALRYSFQSPDKWSPVTVSPGIVTMANLSIESMQYSSVFLGAQLEVSYDTAN